MHSECSSISLLKVTELNKTTRRIKCYFRKLRAKSFSLFYLPPRLRIEYNLIWNFGVSFCRKKKQKITLVSTEIKIYYTRSHFLFWSYVTPIIISNCYTNHPCDWLTGDSFMFFPSNITPSPAFIDHTGEHEKKSRNIQKLDTIKF